MPGHLQANYAEAEPLFEQCITIQEQSLGLEHPELANSLYSQAELYKSQVRNGLPSSVGCVGARCRSRPLNKDTKMSYVAKRSLSNNPKRIGRTSSVLTSRGICRGGTPRRRRCTSDHWQFVNKLSALTTLTWPNRSTARR